ncbi:helix-turn-helix domain-containing protein [Streptomyces sp. NPDC057690]|uniref:helix-turn-helix domain-containing protein n=1 Tax=Streptomyces sp. NPDC057690 TaxID=3346214 RepID=UPI0036A913C6
MARERQNDSGGTELGTFLRAHRATVTPGSVGLPTGPGARRTPGLRREELATLAGVSVDYYVRLERGKETNPSPPVVDALAGALLLDSAEHEHLRVLVARAAGAAALQPSDHSAETILPGIALLLDHLRPFAAYVLTRTMNVLACNPSALRLFHGLADWPEGQRNVVRYVFLHPAAPDVFDDWEDQIRAAVGRLRSLHSLEPDAPGLAELVDELLDASPEFTDLWERYDVRLHTHGSKTFHHPDVGDLTPGYQKLLIEGTRTQRLVIYYAEPGTPDHDKLVHLDMADVHQHAAHPERDGH